MNPSRNEHTIATNCQVSGRGYWTGQDVRVEIYPASAGTGIQFVRTDLDGAPSCSAVVANRRDAHLRTILRKDAARFEMIEHLMAALYALEIDNCRVEINGEEFPGLDGSSLPYVEVLRNAGLIVQAKQRSRLVLDRVVRIEATDRWIQAEPLSEHATQNSYEYQLRFDGESPIVDQTYRVECNPSRFAREIAPARTFVTQSQADSLRAQGVAQHVSNRDLLVFGAEGPIENKLRFKNECARHKTLDLIGDLALVGSDLACKVVSYRGGHNLNGQLALKLAKIAESQKQNNNEAQSSEDRFRSDRKAA